MKNKIKTAMNFKRTIATLFILANCFFATAQSSQTEGVSIKANLSPPNPNAMLDVESANKGVLIPRIALDGITKTTPIASTGPLEKGLIVFNTNTSITTNNQPNGLQGIGMYYWNSAKWVKMGQGSDIPKMTYDQMNAMLPLLTVDDRGMFVFVTTREIPNYYTSLYENCQTPVSAEVFGLWYLTSDYCNPYELLTWRRVVSDQGTPHVNRLPPNCKANCAASNNGGEL